MIDDMSVGSGRRYVEGNRVVNVANISENSMGSNATHFLKGAGTYTAPAGVNVVAITVLADTVITAIVPSIEYTITGTATGEWTAGQSYPMKFMGITISSGWLALTLGV